MSDEIKNTLDGMTIMLILVVIFFFFFLDFHKLVFLIIVKLLSSLG